MTISVEVLFDRIKQVSIGLDQLGVHDHVTPHLVKSHDMQEQVYGLQTELHGSTELLIINLGSDIWKCPTSYVISPELEVAVMVHIPVAKRSSYMYLYRFISTPLMSPGNEFRMLVFPENQMLSINRVSHVAREVREEYYQRCKTIGNGPQHCPSFPIQLKETKSTCLTGLYGNEMQVVVRTCPVLHLNQSQPYATTLSPQHLSVFLPQENTARVTCGEEFLGSVTLPAGLREFSVDPLSKLVTSQMTIEPKLGMVNHEVRFDRIKLNLTSLGNFTEPMAWAVEEDKVATHLNELLEEGKTAHSDTYRLTIMDRGYCGGGLSIGNLGLRV